MGTLYFLESTDLFFKSWGSTRGEGAVQAGGAGAGDLEAARGEPRAGRRVERDLSPPRSTPPLRLRTAARVQIQQEFPKCCQI